MFKIDLKDRKILYQLDVNCRQSARSIGRKVGLSKDVVASRLKKLQENGVILAYYTIFDYLKLGITPLRFYLKYQYVTPEIKEFLMVKATELGCKLHFTDPIVRIQLFQNNELG